MPHGVRHRHPMQALMKRHVFTGFPRPLRGFVPDLFFYPLWAEGSYSQRIPRIDECRIRAAADAAVRAMKAMREEGMTA